MQLWRGAHGCILLADLRPEAHANARRTMGRSRVRSERRMEHASGSFLRFHYGMMHICIAICSCPRDRSHKRMFLSGRHPTQRIDRMQFTSLRISFDLRFPERLRLDRVIPQPLNHRLVPALIDRPIECRCVRSCRRLTRAPSARAGRWKCAAGPHPARSF